MRLEQVRPIYIPPIMPAMRATLSANQSIPTGEYTRVDLDGQDYDTTTAFDGGTHKWTCSEAGKYLISINVGLESLPNGCTASIFCWLNGNFSSPLTRYPIGDAADAYLSSSDILSLVPTDYLELGVYHNAGGNRNVLGGLDYTTWMSIHRLS